MAAQTKIGKVISNKMKNTVIVTVTDRVKHPLYKKMMTKTQNFKVHDELNVEVGKMVKITETRPYSKTVHFKITEVLK